MSRPCSSVRGVGFRRVSAVVAHDAFQFAHPHAVFVRPIGRAGIERFALLQGIPKRRISHDDGIEHPIPVECKLVLAQYADRLRPGDGALLGIDLPGQDFHERRFAGPIGTGNRIASALLEGDGNVFEQNPGAVAHGDIVD